MRDEKAPADTGPEPLAARRGGALRGAAQCPGDKSISHRAILFGALAAGETRVTGLLEGADVLATAEAMRAFGARVERSGPCAWSVHGVGTGGFREPDRVLDMGNSGTSARLIMGAMATTPVTAVFSGDASLSRRPMGRVLEPLRAMGAVARGRSGDLLPLSLTGARDALPIAYRLPVPSAQVKSAVLLAGLNAPGETTIIEPEATRDHTERMLTAFGADVRVSEEDGGRRITVTGEAELSPAGIAVPADPSSAAFPLAAALIVPGSEVVLPGVLLNPTRTGLIATLREMGAAIGVENERALGGETIGDLVVRHGTLTGVAVPAARAASMIDEFPVLSVIAAYATGTTRFHGAGELRVKESDRLAAVAAGLRACGIAVEEFDDGLAIEGRGPDGVPGGGRIETRLDHRIAMSFLIMGLGAQSPVTIDDGRAIATSFPAFPALMRGLGAAVEAP